jgi:hypothetical protein
MTPTMILVVAIVVALLQQAVDPRTAADLVDAGASCAETWHR